MTSYLCTHFGPSLCWNLVLDENPTRRNFTLCPSQTAGAHCLLLCRLGKVAFATTNGLTTACHIKRKKKTPALDLVRIVGECPEKVLRSPRSCSLEYLAAICTCNFSAAGTFECKKVRPFETATTSHSVVDFLPPSTMSTEALVRRGECLSLGLASLSPLLFLSSCLLFSSLFCLSLSKLLLSCSPC